MTDAEFGRVLDFWFADDVLDSPRLDSRMNRWFGNDAELDEQIRHEFGPLVNLASDGKLMHWTDAPESRLALIILLDQFRRNIYRGLAEAFARDNMAIRICIEGTVAGDYKYLKPVQRLFFFMPLQHSESLKIQKKSVSIFGKLAESVSETFRETFLTTADFAELHHDIIAEFGRFPHRNFILGRQNTAAEATYLAGDNPSFGQ
jgi:uncharacterized protein (DUF924 family)